VCAKFHVLESEVKLPEIPQKAAYNLGKEFDNCFCNQFINIGMAGNLGRSVCPGVFVNIMMPRGAQKQRLA